MKRYELVIYGEYCETCATALRDAHGDKNSTAYCVISKYAIPHPPKIGKALSNCVSCNQPFDD